MKSISLNSHRLSSNPDEAAFVAHWQKWNNGGSYTTVLLEALLREDKNEPCMPTEREEVVAETVIQWLGSPVGKSFLSELGYNKGDR